MLAAEIVLEGIFFMLVPPLAREQKGTAREAFPPPAAQVLANPKAGSAGCWLITHTLVRRTELFFLFQFSLGSPTTSLPPSFLLYA